VVDVIRVGVYAWLWGRQFLLGLRCADCGRVVVDFGYVLAFSKLPNIIFAQQSLFCIQGVLVILMLPVVSGDRQANARVSF
jgi:hypothetical protein